MNTLDLGYYLETYGENSVLLLQESFDIDKMKDKIKKLLKAIPIIFKKIINVLKQKVYKLLDIFKKKIDHINAKRKIYKDLNYSCVMTVNFVNDELFREVESFLKNGPIDMSDEYVSIYRNLDYNLTRYIWKKYTTFENPNDLQDYLRHSFEISKKTFTCNETNTNEVLSQIDKDMKLTAKRCSDLENMYSKIKNRTDKIIENLAKLPTDYTVDEWDLYHVQHTIISIYQEIAFRYITGLSDLVSDQSKWYNNCVDTIINTNNEAYKIAQEKIKKLDEQ